MINKILLIFTCIGYRLLQTSQNGFSTPPHPHPPEFFDAKFPPLNFCHSIFAIQNGHMFGATLYFDEQKMLLKFYSSAHVWIEPSVVCFNQRTGVTHAVHWSKSSFFRNLTCFSVTNRNKIRKGAKNKEENLQKGVYQG